MDDSTNDDRAARVRRARQVLAGDEITPPNDPIGFGDRFGSGVSGELRYFIAVAVLIVVSALVYLVWGLGPASVVLFLLALFLLAGWFVL
jgi:VIT1/CCC1 family predicted Fe2+/Mn2+ transporter